jgi:GTPase
LSGTPIRLEFKSPINPCHGQKSKLGDKKVEKRKRLVRRIKKNEK